MLDKAMTCIADYRIFVVFKLSIANAYFWLGISIRIIPGLPNANR